MTVGDNNVFHTKVGLIAKTTTTMKLAEMVGPNSTVYAITSQVVMRVDGDVSNQPTLVTPSMSTI